MHGIRTALFTVAMLQVLPLTPAAADSVLAPKGTRIYAVAEQRVDSKMDHDGDPIVLKLKDGFFHKNPPVLQGAEVEGHLEDVTAASPVHKATLNVIFDDLKLADGATVPLAARLESASVVEPHTHHIRDAGLIIGGAIGGHIVAGRHGAKHGGLLGAAGGFALASSLKSNVVIKRGTQFHLKLTEDLAR